MHTIPRILWIGLLLFVITGAQAWGQGRRVSSLDGSWRFMLGDPREAALPAFDDTQWRTVIVPHDWSIEGPFRQENPTGQGGAFLPSGIGWYRRQFTLADTDRLRRVWVEFDGVMANSEVWINGFALGKRPNGYVSFRYELTGHLHFGAAVPNLLAVRADTSLQPASRWYAGAGIYRHTRLIVTEPVAVAPDSVFITTPQVNDSQATVRIQGAVENRSAISQTVSLRLQLTDPAGTTLKGVDTPPLTIAAGKTGEFTQDLGVPKPDRWSLEQPHLYIASLILRTGKTTLEGRIVPFGIREARFDAATGFRLNGKNLKIKGVCLHQEAGGLGMVVPRSVWERRLTKLKACGVNAVRTAHTPFPPEFFSVCDRLGLLVMDEMFDCWTVGKMPYDYHLNFKAWAERDAHDTVVRDRNHPCIILYSIGNEIHDTPKAELARGILTSLRDVVHAADPTRPVTQALFRPNASHDYTNGLADLLDVIGQNYREKEILAAHQDKPERKILGTENGHDRRAWLALRDNPAYAGQFLWTGIDYLGEAKRWPAISADYGLFDRTLIAHPRAYERAGWWSDTPMVAIARRVAPTPSTPLDPGYEGFQAPTQTLLSDWTPRNVAPHTESVEVYSNCEQVELFLNDRSLGIQARPADASPRLWKVPFVPGVLRAVGRNAARDVATATLQTAGKPARLIMTTDRSKLVPSWDEVAFVTVQVTDANGVLIPDAQSRIAFQLTGPGEIVAVDNGDLTSHEPFQAKERQAYEGRCLVILRAYAPFRQLVLTATADGFPPVSITLPTVTGPRGTMP